MLLVSAILSMLCWIIAVIGAGVFHFVMVIQILLTEVIDCHYLNGEQYLLSFDPGNLTYIATKTANSRTSSS